MRKRRIWLILGAITWIIVAWVTWQFRPLPTPTPFPNDYSPQKAIWMGVTWSMDAHTDAEIDTLAELLTSHEIDYAFVYVSYLMDGNVFNPTFAQAQRFTQRLAVAAPDVTLLGWVGVPVEGVGADGRSYDNRLTDPMVRQQIATFSRQVVNGMGFDGFHLNAELVRDGDPAFLLTLQEIRAVLPEGALLSTTAHALRPTERVSQIPVITLKHHWSTNYLTTVAQNADQVVLMAYDSALIFPTDYRSWMAFQVRASANAMSGSDADLFIGVPAWEDYSLSHFTWAEYLENGLYGVRVGLNQVETPQRITGVSLYADWSIDDNEWTVLDAFR